jgi:hypothetical protein
VVDHLCSFWVGGGSSGAGVRRYHLLYWNTMLAARSLNMEEVGASLEYTLDLIVAAQAPRRLVVRAGVVGWRGKAVLLPGTGPVGKTTLVAALVRAGAVYYSDRYAVFDARGRVHPYRRPPVPPGDAGGSPAVIRTAAAAGKAPDGPLEVGLVAVARYVAGARWRPRALTPGGAALALLADTVRARHRPTFALATLRRAVTGAAALRSPRGEADETVLPLLNCLQRGTPPPASARPG